MSTNVNNYSYCCEFCGSSYKKRINLNNHIVLCEFLRSKCKKIQLEEDCELDDVPSSREMFKLIIELGKKVNALDDKVEELNKWVIKKKKKINIAEWLNTNIVPEYTFDKFISIFKVSEGDIEYLLRNSFIDTFQYIFNKCVCDITENKYPIIAFNQKGNIFYIYENEETKWRELMKEELIKFLGKIWNKIFSSFTDWKKINRNKINEDNKLDDMCNKTGKNIYGIDFQTEATLTKYKNIIHHVLKVDIKAFVEYEFEF